jgi:hypothetical protein
MIAKIGYREKLLPSLLYNNDKVKKQKASVLCSNNILLTSNCRVLPENVIKAFEIRLSLNQRVEKPVVHISLNPDPRDVLSDMQLEDIAHEYMEKMGYRDQPCVVYKCQKKDRQYLCIVTTNIQANGKKVNDSYEQYRSQAVTHKIEQKYNLHSTTISKNRINHENSKF